MVRKTFLPARVEPQKDHFTIEYAVWCGGTSIAYFDNRLRADLVRAALNSYRRTKAGKRWWAARLKENHANAGGERRPAKEKTV